MTVPLLGYLILFNDSVSELLTFQVLIGESESSFGLSGSQRLRCLYFGLVSLGVSNIIYRLRRPYIFRFGTNITEYTRTCLEIFTSYDFTQIHHRIRADGHLTIGGKYYDSEWDGFLADARDPDAGTEQAKNTGDWSLAVRKHGDLLRAMLSENFFRGETTRRPWLTACLMLSSCGYLLLIVPGADLFIKVAKSSFA